MKRKRMPRGQRTLPFTYAERLPSSSYPECPVCGRSMPKTALEDHLDRCLVGEEKESSRGSQTAPPNTKGTQDVPISRALVTTTSSASQAMATTASRSSDLRAFLSLENEIIKGSHRGSITRIVKGVHSTISEEQLKTETPLTIVYNALPEHLANECLRVLLRERVLWPQNEWWVFEEKRLLRRRTATYDFHDNKEHRAETHAAMRHCVPPYQLRDAHIHVKRAVNERIQSLLDSNGATTANVGHLHFALRALPLHSLDRLRQWTPTYALGQSYADGDDYVGSITYAAVH